MNIKSNWLGRLFIYSLVSLSLVEGAPAFAGDEMPHFQENQKEYYIKTMQSLLKLDPSENSIEFKEAIKNLGFEKDELKEMVKAYAAHTHESFPKLETGPESQAREKNFNQFLKVSNQLLPEYKICSYFYDCYQRNILDLNGLNVLVSEFQAKKKYRGKLVESHAIEADQLIPHLNQMEEANFIGEKNFLIKQKGGKHITPVLLKRTETGSSAIILDSLGHPSHYRHQDNTEDLLRNSDLKPLTVFKLVPQRQRDGFSCPIFSLKDVLEHSKQNMFDYVESCKWNYEFDAQTQTVSYPVTADPNGGCLSPLIQILPPQFMKTTQDTQILDAYMASFPHRGNAKISAPSKQSANQADELDEQGRSLFEILDEYKHSSGKSNYTRRRAFKYFNVLIQSLLNQ
jgi:hypothetical protein